MNGETERYFNIEHEDFFILSSRKRKIIRTHRFTKHSSTLIGSATYLLN